MNPRIKGAGVPFQGAKPADDDLSKHPYGPAATTKREGSGGPPRRDPAQHSGSPAPRNGSTALGHPPTGLADVSLHHARQLLDEMAPPVGSELQAAQPPQIGHGDLAGTSLDDARRFVDGKPLAVDTGGPRNRSVGPVVMNFAISKVRAGRDPHAVAKEMGIVTPTELAQLQREAARARRPVSSPASGGPASAPPSSVESLVDAPIRSSSSSQLGDILSKFPAVPTRTGGAALAGLRGRDPRQSTGAATAGHDHRATRSEGALHPVEPTELRLLQQSADSARLARPPGQVRATADSRTAASGAAEDPALHPDALLAAMTQIVQGAPVATVIAGAGVVEPDDMHTLIDLARSQRSSTSNSLDAIDHRLRAETSDDPPNYTDATRNKDLPPTP